jgi:hypothetical protein
LTHVCTKYTFVELDFLSLNKSVFHSGNIFWSLSYWYFPKEALELLSTFSSCSYTFCFLCFCFLTNKIDLIIFSLTATTSFSLDFPFPESSTFHLSSYYFQSWLSHLSCWPILPIWSPSSIFHCIEHQVCNILIIP